MGRTPNLFEGWEILIVDDEDDNLEVLRRFLLLAGAHVTTATCGIEALELLEHTRTLPDFIITDLSMPDLDGFGLLARLRQNERTRHIPLIAITAHAMLGDRERVMKAGFQNYMSKPLRPERFIHDLAAMVKDTLREQSC